MSEHLVAALVVGVISAALGALVPRMIAAVPEPETDDWADDPDATPKPLYVDLSAMPQRLIRSVAVGAVSGGLIGWAVGWDLSLIWLVPLIPVAIALSVIDFHTRLLPRILVIPATAFAVLAVAVVGLVTGEHDRLLSAGLGLIGVRTFFWVLWFIRSAGMGFGDVRLAAPVGLVLGWIGWGALAVGVWFGFIAFVIPGVTLAIVKRDRSLLKKPFPYGPFMIIGALVGLVWGADLAVGLWG